MSFKKFTTYIETKVPSIIGAPIFLILALLLSIAEFILNIDNIFKPMSEWR